MNSRIFAERISIILDYLKKNKIPQYEVEKRLNYTSLSKIKNFDRYPQTIIEKHTRQEIYERLLDAYDLLFDDVTHTIKHGEKETSVSKQKADEVHEEYYLMYYYAFARETVGKAIVRIIDNKKVIIDYRYDEHWEGNLEVIENYTFIVAEKMGEVTPVKKLICLFTGTKKSGRPILIGTYSTVKRDGIPAAGKILFERIEDKKNIYRKIKSDPDPRITYYLINQVLVTETFTPNTLDTLNNTYKMIQRCEGDYYFFYPKANHEILRAELTCYGDSRVNLYLKNIAYSGVIRPIDNHTTRFDLSDKSGFTGIYEDTIVLFAYTSKSQFDPFYYCVGISNGLETTNNSFSCLLIEREIYADLPEEIISSIFNKLGESNSIFIFH